ncbi:MAG: hypothetical protein P4N60_03635 [Verrucomicrobiae bacterium]|nr:hypothetical protein [Verrucomicrobiae bacterium]
MKTIVTLLALAVATLQTVAWAQQQPNLSAASTQVEKPKIKAFTPLDVNQPVTKEQTPINRVGNVSSRPWTQIVGWHNGAATSWNPDTHEAQFCVLSVGR